MTFKNINFQKNGLAPLYKKTCTLCAKDCGPHNRAFEYGRARLRGPQSLAHCVDTYMPFGVLNARG